MSGQQKRKMRGLLGHLHEAERAARALGHSEKSVAAMAVDERAKWPRWAR